jgi:uncharacterized membrane protein
MRNISRAFLTGLAAILPIAVTVYVLYWAGDLAEKAMRKVVTLVLPEDYYVFGMGIVAGVVVILLVGLSFKAWVVRKVYYLAERLVQQIPIVKTVYGAVNDLIAFFTEKKDQSTNQVVMVTLGDTNVRLMGFATREDWTGYPDGMADEDTVAVFLPMSYQMGGFTTMVPRSAVQPIDMSFQDAMRFALTAGMSSGNHEI